MPVPNAIVFYIRSEFPVISVTTALGTGIMLRKQFDDIKTQPRTQFRKRYTMPFAITPTKSWYYKSDALYIMRL